MIKQLVRMVSFPLAFAMLSFAPSLFAAEQADVILHNGKVITVDAKFSIAQAVALKGNRILAVGTNDDVLKTRGDKTEMVDLQGKVVMPGLIDSHTHAASAAMTEFDHPIPQMETIADVLAYVKSRADVLEDGEWILLSQVFITRLKEQRYPTRAELDAAAPKNPVVFRTGPDASLNSLALQLSGIDKNFKIPEGARGKIERDPETGEPTGIIRDGGQYIKSKSPKSKPVTAKDRRNQMELLFKDYNSVGLTMHCERSVSAGMLEDYQALDKEGRLTVRTALSYRISENDPLDKIAEEVRRVAKHPLTSAEGMLRIIGVKFFLDGGMLTGSAYMLKPWGVSKIYAITDPTWRGSLFIPPDKLTPMVRSVVENNLQFTAHTVGDGAVHTLLDAYEEVNRSIPVRDTHPCICHSNFMSKEAVEKAARLGVVMDIQPAWLYLDTRTLVDHFGYDRLRYFQPLRSLFEAGAIAGGGSDHMQKIGSLRSNNPYDPFLGMWTTVTRKAKWYAGRLHPEEAMSSEPMIKFYTINNAYVLRAEKQVGSLEPGKLADLIVLDTDLLTCPDDAIRDAKVLRTYVDGKLVFERK
ncbi:MAG: amidohydrolase [Candidatus Sumerlaeia bacterium]|nr:amidohydrolase [Candidatus Sumerlaeia bacterium]